MAQGHRVGIVNGLRFGLIDEVVGFWPLSLSLRSAGSSIHLSVGWASISDFMGAFPPCDYHAGVISDNEKRGSGWSLTCFALTALCNGSFACCVVARSLHEISRCVFHGVSVKSRDGHGN